MNVTVSCPACHLPTTVAEDDVLTAKITCARCGLAFAPLGPEPEPAPPEPAEPPATSQKIPGYGPRGRAPRPAAPRPRKPDGEKPGAEARFTRRAVAVGAVGVVGLLGLAAAGGVGLWAVRRANRGAAGGADDGDWQAYALPDAPEVTVEFPAPPVVADEPIDTVNERGAVVRSETLRVFVARNPRDGCDYVVRVGRVKLKPWVVFAGPPAGDVFEDWNGNAETTIRELTSLIRDSEPGPLEPTTCNGYPAVQQVVRTKGGGPYVVRAIGLDISDYVLFVRGPGAEPNSPSVRHFFNSFRHAHVPPPETDYRKPDGEALKPLATVQWFYWASFTPKCDGVYLIHRDSGPEQYIVRYDYPSFRPIARSGPIPHCNDGVIDNRARTSTCPITCSRPARGKKSPSPASTLRI